MSHCAAVGCNNQTSCNTNVSYHRLPKEKSVRKAWINAIGRTELPKNTYLCSDHFEDHCFDQSQELKRRMMRNEKILRKLVRGAIPTKFPHKPPQTPRLSSVSRARKKEQTAALSTVLSEVDDVAVFIEAVKDSGVPEENLTKSHATVSTQTEEKQCVDIGTQTIISHLAPVYVKDAMTSTLTLKKSKQKSCMVQVHINSPKKLKRNASTQYSKNVLSPVRHDEFSEDISDLSSTESESDTDSSDAVDVQTNDNGVVYKESVSVGNVNMELNQFVYCGSNQLVNTELYQPAHSELNSNEDEESVSETSTAFDDSYAISEDPNDVEYVPSDGDLTDDESATEIPDTKRRFRYERTLLIYESKLRELLSYCPKCGCGVDQSLIQEIQNTGSQLHLKISCFNNCNVEWKSQPDVGQLKGLGNLYLSTGIAFSGIPFAKFQRFAWLINLKFLSDNVFYELRRDYILPVIKKRFKKERQYMLNLLKKRRLVILVGDGRCDSPGHNAKYCTYTFIEVDTGMVVDTVVVPVTDVKNSNCMEKEGFVRGLEGLKRDGVKIDVISTDRHIQIRKLMRTDPRFNNIKHQFDPWHIIKGVSKKLNNVAKKTSRQKILQWIPSIVNHFWWSLSTSNGNHEVMYEKFTSILFHVVNKHEWGGYKVFKKCAHEKLTSEEERSKEWLDEGSDAYETLRSIIKHRNMKADLKYITDAINTTKVEVFNNLLLKYLPKQYHFEYDHMVMGCYLAALDHNFNSNREQDETFKGNPKFKIAWRKTSKKFIARKVYKKKNYEFLKIMMSGVYKQANKNRKGNISRKRIMAPSDKESRDDIIERTEKYSRYK